MAGCPDVIEPFKTLHDLYENIGKLNLFPIPDYLRKCTEYVYAGSEVEVRSRSELTKLDRDAQPRTIVCHDMKGGYLQDRFMNGASEVNPYAFYHWSMIDTFIYFSHHLITIPPLGWMNAAHKHGVKILGTVITEHKDGEKVWDEVLRSEEETKKFADALITVARYYAFEGWLLNVENKIKEEHMDMLKFFVKYLTDRLHRHNEDAQVIWYDSVITDGSLKWQNELNEKNKTFFDCCDGIFLNYNWDEEKLANSCKIAAENGRIRDIYVGLDVWGRGCPGGGGFNSIYALRKIRKFNLSVAIFAPGWTHENFGPSTFEKVENIFWAQLAPLLYVHVPVYENEEFQTAFCRGYGKRFWRFGMILDDEPYYNITFQRFQISGSDRHSKFIHEVEQEDHRENNEVEKKELSNVVFETAREKFKIENKQILFSPKDTTRLLNSIEYCDEFAFHGGGCLRLYTRVGHHNNYHRLFIVHLEYWNDIEVVLTYKEGPTTDPGVDEYFTPAPPVLALFNGQYTKYVQPDEITDSQPTWRECHYTTDLRTINEIGLIISAGTEYFIGEIVVKASEHVISRNSPGGLN